jgi:hypothetical protein
MAIFESKVADFLSGSIGTNAPPREKKALKEKKPENVSARL